MAAEPNSRDVNNRRIGQTVIMEVKPFKAFRFNAALVGDTGRCIAPPYDVINDEDREKLYGTSEYNVVRIIKGKTTPSDNGEQNQYTRAAEFLRKWIGEGALKQDEKDTIYGYIQDFERDGTAFQRLTFIALGKLEDFGKTVRPHEQVFAKPMLDRLNLKRATAARFGLVFMLYEDPQGTADRIIARAGEQPPLVDFLDSQDVRHRLFAVTDAKDIQDITEMMADKSCIIADGHHRYTTGLTYMRESGNPAARYQMLAFTNAAHEGLVVLATHRVVGGIQDLKPQEFLRQLEDGFAVKRFEFGSEAEAKESARGQMLAEMKAVHDQGGTALASIWATTPSTWPC